ncbi:MAG TPA: hypothetical protein VKU60_01815 [Chloroflexota bacterium]|nr:hypothetical protein [Chloroflexota bacterium]
MAALLRHTWPDRGDAESVAYSSIWAARLDPVFVSSHMASGAICE